MIRIVILQGVKKGFVSVSLAWRSRGERLQRGRAAIAFHWQADKQGAAWRQEGHYQRLGQTEIRASFGPGRQASAHTHTHTHAHKHTHTPALETSPWKDCKAWDELLCTLEMPIVKC